MTKIEMMRFEDFYDPKKVVTNSNPISRNEFSVDGIFSESIFGKESDPDNIDSIAWIDLGDNYIMYPLMYSRVSKLIKPSILNAILEFSRRIDSDGNFTEDDEDSKGHVFEHSNLGLYEFRKQFIHILRTYTPDEKKLHPEYRNLIKWYFEDKVFTNKIPIFSPKLRPAQIFTDDRTFQFSAINNFYNFIIQHSNLIKAIEGDNELEDVQLQKMKMMYKLQMDFIKTGDAIIDFIKDKQGVIRKNILAGRVNFSSRNVIKPDPNLAVNEVIVNYKTFLSIYKIPLINLISLSEGKTYSQASNFIDTCLTKVNKKLHRYMWELINKTKGGMRAILNRNPSISIHSIQIVKIVGVSADTEDYTLSVSNNILAGMGGDFDGRIHCYR